MQHELEALPILQLYHEHYETTHYLIHSTLQSEQNLKLSHIQTSLDNDPIYEFDGVCPVQSLLASTPYQDEGVWFVVELQTVKHLGEERVFHLFWVEPINETPLRRKLPVEFVWIQYRW